MKQKITILAMLITVLSFAQTTVHNTKVKLKNVNTGVVSDSLLVIAPNDEVRKIPRSVFLQGVSVDLSAYYTQTQISNLLGNYAIGDHTVDTNTQLSEAQVDAFTANNDFVKSGFSRNLKQAQSFVDNLRDVYLDDGASYFANTSAYNIAKNYELGIQPTLAFYPSAVKAGVWYNASDDRTLDGTVSRSTTATYTNQYGKIATAAINELRVDYSDGLNKPKLLLEDAATNLVDNSDMGNVISSNLIFTNTTSPDVSNTARQFNVPNEFSRFEEFLPANTYTTGQKLVYSWYVNGANFSDNGFDGYLSVKNLVNVIAVGSVSKIQSNINGFDRYQVVVEVDNGSLESKVRLYFEDSIGLGQSEVAYWGHQLELGSKATSYIPTSGTTATRAVDIVNNAGNVNTFNDNYGTIFFEGAKTEEERDCRVSLNDGGADNRLTLIFESNTNNLRVLSATEVGSPYNGTYTDSSFDNTNNNKYALTYGVNGAKLYINGDLKLSTNDSLTFNGLNSLDIRAAASVSLNFFGTVSDYRYYNTELSDSELINLTK